MKLSTIGRTKYYASNIFFIVMKVIKLTIKKDPIYRKMPFKCCRIPIKSKKWKEIPDYTRTGSFNHKLIWFSRIDGYPQFNLIGVKKNKMIFLEYAEIKEIKCHRIEFSKDYCSQMLFENSFPLQKYSTEWMKEKTGKKYWWVLRIKKKNVLALVKFC